MMVGWQLAVLKIHLYLIFFIICFVPRLFKRSLSDVLAKGLSAI